MPQYTRYPVPFGPLPIFDSAVNLPPFETDGYTAIVRDTNTIYAYDTGTSSWIPVATPGAAIAIDGLTGDVTATGPGVVPATISPNAVDNSKLVDMPNNTVKGNKSGSTGDPQDLALSDVVESGSAVLTITNGTKSVVQASNLSIQVSQSTTSTSGYLSSTDWNTFNNKQNALTLPLSVSNGGTGASTLTTGNVILGAGSSPVTFVAPGTSGNVLTSNGASWVSSSPTAVGIVSLNGDSTAAQTLVTGTAGTDFAIVDNGTGQHTFNIPSSSASNRGLLTAADWSTFNAKQPAGNYITALTGDATASGPGSVPITLATVNGNVGTFGTATQVGSFTANAKGLITAASNTAIAITASQVTDFNEAAQDAVGGILTDTSSIDLTYNDGANTISGVVLPAGVDHNSLANLTTGDPHTQYFKLGGRSGGQVANGGTAASDNLSLRSTANATLGNVYFQGTTSDIYISDMKNLIIGTDFFGGVSDFSLNRDFDLDGAGVHIAQSVVPQISDSVGGGVYYGFAMQPNFTGTNNLGTMTGALYGVTCDSSGTSGVMGGLDVGASYTGSGNINTVFGGRFQASSEGTIIDGVVSLVVIEPSGAGVVGSKSNGLLLAGTYACPEIEDSTSTGTINSYNIVNSNYYFTNAGGVTINGLSNGNTGKRVLLQFLNGATINNNSGSAAAGDRILISTGLTITIVGRGSIEVIYSAVDGAWSVISQQL